MTNEFVRQTCLLIRHDAAMAEYREDGWKKKALIGAGVAAAAGAAGYAGYKNRGKIGQGISSAGDKLTGSGAAHYQKGVSSVAAGERGGGLRAKAGSAMMKAGRKASSFGTALQTTQTRRTPKAGMY